jgi:VCBS repeat-containing protein
MRALAGGAVLVAVAAVLMSNGPAASKAEPGCAAGGVKVSSTDSPASIAVKDTRTNTAIRAVVTIKGADFTIAPTSSSPDLANASWCLKASTKTQTGSGTTGTSNIRNQKGVPHAIGYLIVYGVTSVQPNRAPVALDDGPYLVDVGSTLNITAPGVLGNDTDPDADALTTANAGTPQSGTLVVDPNGSFSYTPSSTTVPVTDTFAYQATDGTATSNPATVTIVVNPYVAAKAICVPAPAQGTFFGPGSNIGADTLWGCNVSALDDPAAANVKIQQLQGQCVADGGDPVTSRLPSVQCRQPLP